MMTNIIGVEPKPENLPIDMPVEVTGSASTMRSRCPCSGRAERAMSLRMSAAIVGRPRLTQLGVIPEKSAIEFHAEAARRAIADAGMTKDDVDAVLCAGQSPVAVAEYLGIVPTYIDGTGVGGCSFMIHVRHAAAASRRACCRPR